MSDLSEIDGKQNTNTGMGAPMTGRLDRRDFLRAAGAGAAMLALPRLGLGEEKAPLSAPSGKRPPNIVFILADDLGFGALTCYGGDRYQGQTPNLDALSAGGMRFTRCHTTPVCGPSRCQFLTGLYPFRTGFVENGSGKGATPDKFPPVAKALKNAGYATGMVGKWHELRPAPDGWGFDEYLKSPAVAGVYWIRAGGTYTVNGQQVSPKERVFFADVMHGFAEDFITRHREHPFFLYYPMHYPHAGPGLGETPDGQPPLATMDRMVGKVMAVLDRLGLRENTLLIFASDNGGMGGPIGGRNVAGGKRGLREGGCTVPFIANWPGVVPAGKVNDELVDFADMLPTFVELAGGKLPAGQALDGVSIVPQLRGEKGNPKGWAFAQIRDKWMVRDTRWKLTHTGELYDLSDGLFVETLMPADAESETRKRLDAIAERLGVRQAVQAHPEWTNVGK
jgi:arylsulfatase A